jgi:hypothetical protein
VAIVALRNWSGTAREVVVGENGRLLAVVEKGNAIRGIWTTPVGEVVETAEQMIWLDSARTAVPGEGGTQRVAATRGSVHLENRRPLSGGVVELAVWIPSSVIVPRAVVGAVGIQPGAVARVFASRETSILNPAGIVEANPETVASTVAGEPGRLVPDKESAPRETGNSNVRAQAISPT